MSDDQIPEGSQPEKDFKGQESLRYLKPPPPPPPKWNNPEKSTGDLQKEIIGNQTIGDSTFGSHPVENAQYTPNETFQSPTSASPRKIDIVVGDSGSAPPFENPPPTPQYQPGDIVNGHVLLKNGIWVRINNAGSPVSPPAIQSGIQVGSSGRVRGNEKVCPQCYYIGMGRTNTEGSCLIEGCLWVFFFIPGVIYSLWRVSSRKTVCSSCGSPNMIPIASAKGREFARYLGVSVPENVPTSDKSLTWGLYLIFGLIGLWIIMWIF